MERTTRAAAATICALYTERLPRAYDYSPTEDIQVLCPSRKGMTGSVQLNRMLQDMLNPPSPQKNEITVRGSVLRVGDKVMQVRNNYDLAWEKDGEEGDGVFNGDIGYIVAVDRKEKALTVEFDDGRVADYDESALDELELAYCMSVHKSQGSEFDAVVLPLVSGPPMLMTRNLLYTAVTRAKRLVVIVGREGCVRQMVDNNHILRRYSALDVRLKKKQG